MLRFVFLDQLFLSLPCLLLWSLCAMLLTTDLMQLFSTYSSHESNIIIKYIEPQATSRQCMTKPSAEQYWLCCGLPRTVSQLFRKWASDTSPRHCHDSTHPHIWNYSRLDTLTCLLVHKNVWHQISDLMGNQSYTTFSLYVVLLS